METAPSRGPAAAPPAGRFAGRPPILTSALLAVAAAALFAVVPPSVRALTDTMTAFQVVFVRAVFGIAAIGGYFLWAGPWQLRTARPFFHLQRSTLNFVGMVLWFWALEHVALAKGIAIHFTLPLFISVFAIAFLGERFGLRRAAALLAGFAGALVILRPGMVEISVAEIAILGSAALYGGSVILLKVIVRDEKPIAITFHTNVVMGLLCLPFTILWWVPMTAADILPVAGVGLCGLFAPFLFTTALKAADASIMGAFDFLRLPFTAVFAYALFGEVPDMFTWIGAGIIFASTWYITLREARRQRGGG